MKQKNTILLSILTLSILTVSCDMNKQSPDSLTFGQAFTSMDNIEALERGAYSRLRTAINPYIITMADVQTDYVNAVNGFTNIYSDYHDWTYAYDDTEIESAWYYLYAGISQYNFIITGIRNSLGFTPTNAERNDLNIITGEMHLMRALCYSLLAERFCADYDEATANTQYSGLPLVKSYNSDNRPDRSTLKETYSFILADLDTAATHLSGISGTPNSIALNGDCVTALKARVLLQMDNYSDALKEANKLIANTTYSLVESEEELRKMWTEDESTETIFQFYSSNTETSYQWGYYFYQDYYNGVGTSEGEPFYMFTPDYIPTQDCIDTYSTDDWRRSVYFRDCSPEDMSHDYLAAVMIKGANELAQNATIISKFPGDPDLNTSTTWEYYNTWKVFRLAEIYLIAAEAAAMSTDGDVLTPLNALREHRGLQPLQAATIDDVREERYRELLLEGHRLNDLKRWDMGMTRGTEQNGYLSPNGAAPWYGDHGSYTSDIGRGTTIEAGDYRFVWPIPAQEIFASPQYASQQNPGWKR